MGDKFFIRVIQKISQKTIGASFILVIICFIAFIKADIYFFDRINIFELFGTTRLIYFIISFLLLSYLLSFLLSFILNFYLDFQNKARKKIYDSFLERPIYIEKLSEISKQSMFLGLALLFFFLFVWGIDTKGAILLVILFFLPQFLSSIIIGRFEREHTFTLGLESLDKLIKSENLKEIEPYETYWYLEKAIKKLCVAPYFTEFPIEELKFKENKLKEFDLGNILDAVGFLLYYGDKDILKKLSERIKNLRSLENENRWNRSEILRRLLELSQFSSGFLKEMKIELKERKSWYDRIIYLSKNNVLPAISTIIMAIFGILAVVLSLYI